MIGLRAPPPSTIQRRLGAFRRNRKRSFVVAPALRVSVLTLKRESRAPRSNVRESASILG